MLISGTITNFVAIPILTVAHKWGLILTKMFVWSASNYRNFNNYGYIFCLLIDFHSKNIIHWNLKLKNILIKHVSQNTFIIKVTDFGLSREFNNKSFSTHVGTPYYSAPEQFSKNNYEPTKCDLWAIDVIIYKLKFDDIYSIHFVKEKSQKNLIINF